MDHRGLRARLAGAACTSCGAAIPGDRIDVLADRGDIAFVELSCPSCDSRTMGLVLGTDSGTQAAILDTALHPELDPASEARLAGAPPISIDDVQAMHAFLATWTGDAHSLLGGHDRPGPEADR